MNWRKYLLIALVAGGCAFAPAPQSDAGVSVGIGVGFPGAYPYYGYYPYGRIHITRTPIIGPRFTSDRRFTGTMDAAFIIRVIAITVTGGKQTIEKIRAGESEHAASRFSSAALRRTQLT